MWPSSTKSGEGLQVDCVSEAMLAHSLDGTARLYQRYSLGCWSNSRKRRTRTTESPKPDTLRLKYLRVRLFADVFADVRDCQPKKSIADEGRLLYNAFKLLREL